MKIKLRSLLTAAVVGIASLAASSAFAGTLATVTSDSLDSQIFKAPMVSIILVTGQNCANCQSVQTMLEQEADKYPGVRFVTADAQTFNEDEASLPVIVVHAPAVGFTYNQEMFAPADMEQLDVFVAAHVDIAIQEMGLQQDMDALSAQMQEKYAPFRQAERKVSVQEDNAIAKLEARIQELQQRVAVIEAPYQKQKLAIEDQYDQAVKELGQEHANKNAELEGMYQSELAQSQAANKVAEAKIQSQNRCPAKH